MNEGERQCTQLPFSGDGFILDLTEEERRELDERDSLCVYWERGGTARTMEMELIQRLESHNEVSTRTSSTGTTGNESLIQDACMSAPEYGCVHELAESVPLYVPGGDNRRENIAGVSERQAEWQRAAGHGALNSLNVAHSSSQDGVAGHLV